jgi:two-component system, NtrC family, response regulator HydG
VLMTKILVVDDDVSFTMTLKAYLQRQGFETDEAFSCQKAIDKLNSSSFEVVLTDFRLPDKNGIELLQAIKEKTPDSLVIIMTAYADIKMAVKAIKFGAYEYVAKPVNPDELLGHIQSGLKKRNDEKNLSGIGKSSSPTPSAGDVYEYLEARSREAQVIQEHINLVAPTDMSVIIQGESGTGKEFIARRIHDLSQRARMPFVAVDCGALSKELAGSEFFGHVKGSFTGAVQDKTGQFAAANKGTLFLDEIGNLSYDIQVKLLRALQERTIKKMGSNKDIPVDVRIIVATNDDLHVEVKNGNFREDLYHRLNEFTILVTPLRERKDDVRLFIDFFLNKANKELNKNATVISEDLWETLLNYSWPGNIREIKNVIKRAVLLSKGNELGKNSLPQEIIFSSIVGADARISSESEATLKDQTGQTEKEIILATLQKTRYNKSKAAKLLNIDRRTLYNKLKLYDIPLE